MISGALPAPRLGIAGFHLIQGLLSTAGPHDLIHRQSLAKGHGWYEGFLSHGGTPKSSKLKMAFPRKKTSWVMGVPPFVETSIWMWWFLVQENHQRSADLGVREPQFEPQLPRLSRTHLKSGVHQGQTRNIWGWGRQVKFGNSQELVSCTNWP